MGFEQSEQGIKKGSLLPIMLIDKVMVVVCTNTFSSGKDQKNPL